MFRNGFLLDRAMPLDHDKLLPLLAAPQDDEL
jgi:hypothetical protein